MTDEPERHEIKPEDIAGGLEHELDEEAHVEMAERRARKHHDPLPKSWHDAFGGKHVVSAQLHPKLKTQCWKDRRHRLKKGGHVQVSVKGKLKLAHRLSYELANSVKLDDNKQVQHICNVSNCIRPDHLTTGSHQDNMKDLRLKNWELKQ